MRLGAGTRVFIKFLLTVSAAGVCVQNRELQIMKQLKHSNVVELKCSFYSKGEKVSFLPTAREINSITACMKGLPLVSVVHRIILQWPRSLRADRGNCSLFN